MNKDDYTKTFERYPRDCYWVDTPKKFLKRLKKRFPSLKGARSKKLLESRNRCIDLERVQVKKKISKTELDFRVMRSYTSRKAWHSRPAKINKKNEEARLKALDKMYKKPPTKRMIEHKEKFCKARDIYIVKQRKAKENNEFKGKGLYKRTKRINTYAGTLTQSELESL